MTKVQSYLAKKLGKNPGLNTLFLLKNPIAIVLKRLDVLCS